MPKPTTIAEYIAAAPAEGRPHLERIFALLKEVAPEAEPVMKWNTPFFIEPRFLFSFAAFKSHLSFAPSEETMVKFNKELSGHPTTKNLLKVPYNASLPEDLIRKIAVNRVAELQARKDDSFW